MNPKGRWLPGQSGNPAGKKPGRTFTTRLRAALDTDFDQIVRQMIVAALAGDMRVAEFLVSRVCPPLKTIDEPVSAELPNVGIDDSAADVLRKTLNGEITPTGAETILRVIAAYSRILDDSIRRDCVEKHLENLG